MVTSTLERLFGQHAHLYHRTQQMRLVRDRFFHHGVQLDFLQSINIFRCAWRCRSCAQLWSTNWWVMTKFGVRVVRVECKSNLAGWWTPSNIVLEGVVAMVLEPAWRELTCRDFDVWLRRPLLGFRRSCRGTPREKDPLRNLAL
jgi:hypothetical protein